MKKMTLSFGLVLVALVSSAQKMPVNDQEIALRHSFISTVHNRIQNASSLYPFFEKLKMVRDGARTVSVVHIGDSHIQADFLSGVVRNKLQAFFGNAGRGLVFPYQLAQSNAPSDISSSSNKRWQFNRVAHPEIAIEPGVSGFCLRTDLPEATFTVSLKNIPGVDNSFNRIKFFTDYEAGSRWTINAPEEDILYPVDSGYALNIMLNKHATEASFTVKNNGSQANLYGISLENSKPGILYHTIGVNGARYDQYNGATIFWNQLGGLRADLYIVSLGTNEAQAASVNTENFEKEIAKLVQKLRDVSPNAAILITTAPDSYRKGKSNPALKAINETIARFCEANKIPVWNLYKTTNGYGSAYSWNKRKLMSRDRVHFTADGYRMQGNLLFNAMAKSYNDFLSVKN